MDAEQRREWDAFTQDAAQRLLDGAWILRLSVMPSFSDWTMAGITIHDQVVVRRWARENDAGMFATPADRLRHPNVLTPTIAESIVQVSRTEVDALTSGLDALAISIRPLRERVTLDGTSFGLVVHCGSCWIELHWNSVPQEWAGLSRWFGETLERLHQTTKT